MNKNLKKVSITERIMTGKRKKRKIKKRKEKKEVSKRRYPLCNGYRRRKSSNPGRD